MKTFSGLKAKNYRFLHEDGSSRNVIALYAGSKRIAFMEYGHTARKFVDQIHDLCDDHDRELRSQNPMEEKHHDS